MTRSTFPAGEEKPMLKERYINPFTDFGFKRLFGEEPHKDLLIDFLNELLKGEQAPIKELTYLKTERLGPVIESRGAIFDLYCESETGEKFIVEIQKAKQKWFKDRSVYYASFPIQEQAQRGQWDFRLEPVYTVAILDFVFDDDVNEPNKYFYKVKLTDIETCKVFYEKLTFLYLEMPKFQKQESELETHFDKWLYVLRHLQNLTDRPARLQERVFQRLFEAAEITRFDHGQRMSYEESLKHYRDAKNVLDFAEEKGRAIGREEGREEGRLEERVALARKMIKKGMDAEDIIEMTGLKPGDWAE